MSASGCVDVQGGIISTVTITFMNVARDVHRDWPLLDGCSKLLTATTHARSVAVIDVLGWSVRKQDIHTLRDLHPLLSQGLALWQVEGPLAKFRLPRRAIDHVTANFSTRILQVNAILQKFSNFLAVCSIHSSIFVSHSHIETTFPIMLLMECNIMVSSNHNLNLGRVCLQPLIEAFDLRDLPDVCKVTRVKQNISRRTVSLGNAIVQAMRITEAYKPRPSIWFGICVRIVDDARPAGQV
mmetsp:Transcript_102390/g.177669  ORF Transcript_102390/g.177669 Transcript_102390/m.177669 type:complete len:240 (-) Transcript_102390:254-973(-)